MANRPRRIKINFTPSTPPTDTLRPVVTSLAIHGMEWGAAWLPWDRRRYRVIRWRRFGLCRYVLVGRDRGLVVPMVRNFQKVKGRPALLTKEEEKKVNWWIQRRRLYE